MSRGRLVFGLVLLVPLGLATKVYAGPGEAFVRGSLGGILYVVFFTWLVLLVRPALRPAVVALFVFAATCLLECLQLWHPPLLERVRATFLGHALLGSTFAAEDFLAYAVGCLLAMWSEALLR